MNLVLKGHYFEYELRMLLKLFYPNEEFQITDCIAQDGITLITAVDEHFFSVQYYHMGSLVKEKNLNDSQYSTINIKLQKRLLKKVVYDLLCDINETSQPWGMLTGIRPTKIVFELMKKYNGDVKKVRDDLKDSYGIADNKIDLMLQIVDTETKILKHNKDNQVSLYIGIPFCPTRCLYCSFTAYPINQWKDRVKDYLSALKQEISYVSNCLFKHKSIRTLYIGGGTPTSLNWRELEVLMEMIDDHFDLNQIDEFTVEAGRPDTINEDKLRVLKAYEVDRLSINPQTMNQKTLDVIGRRHSVKEIIEAYQLARHIGFDNINMDIILGLPDESIHDVMHTMKEINQLAPDNLTVHTMAVKRASKLKENLDQYVLQTKEQIEKMLDYVYQSAKTMGLEPYYMYRQKNMVGNFENVGYSKSGKECIYNIEIMEEMQTILALGAGAMSKIVFLDENRIERIENVKNVEHYIKRIDEMIQRKEKFLDKINW